MDSIAVTLHKRLEIVRNMLPDTLYVDYGYYADRLIIGDKVKRGIFTKYYGTKGNYIKIDYTDVTVNDKKYYGLAMKIADKFDLDLVINYYENPEVIV